MSCPACQEKAQAYYASEARKNRWGFLSLIWKYLRIVLFSPKVSKDIANKRLALCRACPLTERDDDGRDTDVRLARTINDKLYCGAPRIDKMYRDERRKGCGCNIESKVKYEASECPRSVWGPGERFNPGRTIILKDNVDMKELRRRSQLPVTSPPDVLMARLNACANCQEKNRLTGERLYRVIDGNVFCGAPKVPGEIRVSALEGCGCNMTKTAAIYGGACLRDKWGPYEASNPLTFEDKMKMGLVVLDANGIGDLCIALLVYTGLKAAQPDRQIALAVRGHLMPWARLFKVDHVLLADDVKPEEFSYTCRPNEGKLKFEWPSHGKDSWVEGACKLCFDVTPQIPPLADPVDMTWLATQKIEGSYVVLAPFAQYQVRSWPLHRWIELARELEASGRTVVVVDNPSGELRCRVFGIENDKNSTRRIFPGLKPAELIQLLYGAEIVVGNDSGIVHLAATLSKTALAIHGSTNGRATFGGYGEHVQWVESDLKCASCYWDAAKGFRPECNQSCDALWSISVETVLTKIKQMTGR